MESLFKPVPTGAPPRLRPGVLLAALDLLAGFTALLAPMALRYGMSAPPEHLYSALAWMPLFLAWRLAMAHAFGLHDFRRRLAPSDHIFGGLGAALAGALPGYLFLALTQLYYDPIAQFSRAVVVMDTALLALWYAASRAAALTVLQRAGWRLRVLLAGPENDCAPLAEEIRRHAPGLVELTGIAPLDPAAGRDGADALLRDWVDPGRIDRVILSTAALTDACLGAVVVGCDRRGIEVCVNPDVRLALLAGADVFSLAGLPLVRLSPNTARSGYGLVKRAMDLAVATPALVLSAPIMLVAAAAIRLAGGGPAFYAQDRIGLFGKRFRLYKLRTMIVGAEDETGPVLASSDDPRITPVGRQLRRMRIDELPQLWNVIRGEMSLVGPRPERAEFAETFVRDEPFYLHRLLVRPGLTGLAQIHGRYDTEYRQKLRYDLIYLNVMSARTDLRILAATARTILTGRGAV
jgi:exopolysaccharide biosynthesis polyprenyl glycosylphosphotransferase